MLCLCCLINMTQISFDSTIKKISSGLTIAFTCIIVLMPFAATLFLYGRFGKLGNEHYLSRFGSLYSELSYAKSRDFIYEPVFFLLRRLILAMVVVLNRVLVFQFLVMISSVLAWVMLVSFAKPYQTQALSRIQIFNEYFVRCILYTFMCFTDLIYD